MKGNTQQSLITLFSGCIAWLATPIAGHIAARYAPDFFYVSMAGALFISIITALFAAFAKPVFTDGLFQKAQVSGQNLGKAYLLTFPIALIISFIFGIIINMLRID